MASLRLITESMVASVDLFSMAGRSAIVWGGGAGIGAETVRLLAAHGARVTIVDRDPSLAETVREAVLAAGGSAVAAAADVRLEASVEHAVRTATDAFGVPTLSASVVGVAGWADLIDMTAQMWDDQLALNLRPMFLIGRTVARALRDAEIGGSLAFVGSIAGAQGAGRHAAYGAAKGAMVSLARSMAVEWGSLGIRVNCLASGPIATDRIAPSVEMTTLLARKLPAGRFGTPSEIAQALVWLLSDAASFITGETLYADGGWMAAAPITAADNPRLPPH